METALAWFGDNWQRLTISLGVFVVALAVLLSLRWIAMRAVESRLGVVPWLTPRLVFGQLRGLSLVLAIVAAAGLAIIPFPATAGAKQFMERSLLSVLVVVLGMSAYVIVETLYSTWSRSLRLPYEIVNLNANVVRIVVIALFLLVLLGIWGLPTTPIAILLAAVLIAGVFAMRRALENWVTYALYLVNRSAHIGDHIRLDTEEEGVVIGMSWQCIVLRTDDGRQITIPMTKFVQATVTNFGRPIRSQQRAFYRAVEYVTSDLPQTRAELREWLRREPMWSVYWQVFNVWVRDGLGDTDVATTISRIDPSKFPLEGLRAALLETLNRQLPVR